MPSLAGASGTTYCACYGGAGWPHCRSMSEHARHSGKMRRSALISSSACLPPLVGYAVCVFC